MICSGRLASNPRHSGDSVSGPRLVAIVRLEEQCSCQLRDANCQTVIHHFEPCPAQQDLVDPQRNIVGDRCRSQNHTSFAKTEQITHRELGYSNFRSSLAPEPVVCLDGTRRAVSHLRSVRSHRCNLSCSHLVVSSLLIGATRSRNSAKMKV